MTTREIIKMARIQGGIPRSFTVKAIFNGGDRLEVEFRNADYRTWERDREVHTQRVERYRNVIKPYDPSVTVELDLPYSVRSRYGLSDGSC